MCYGGVAVSAYSNRLAFIHAALALIFPFRKILRDVGKTRRNEVFIHS